MIKNFLNALCAFAAFVSGVVVLFVVKRVKGKDEPSLDSEKMDLKIKFKQIEARNEIEQEFQNKSDRDIVLDAINEESRKRKP
jgi:hypothetical protein